MKGSIAELQDSPIQFCEAVCAIGSPSNDDHRSDVVWLGLASEAQVRSRVAYKNQVTGLEVVGKDGVLVLLLKLADGGKARFEDVVVNGVEVFFVHLKLASTGGDEVSGVEQLSEVGDKKHSKGDVKREKGLDPMRHVEGGVAGGPANGCAVSPEDVWCASQPLRSVAFTSLDEGLDDGAVLLLNNAICMQVVSGNADVSDTIPIRKPVKHGDIRYAIVGDDLFDGTPPAQNFLEKKHTKSAACLSAESTPLRPGGKGAVGLGDVTEATGRGHKRGVDIELAEKWGGDCDGGQNVDLGGLAKLALMAGGDVPFDILLEGGPPEVVEDGASS